MIDPAYVVFSLENQDLLNEARDFFSDHGVRLMGRYGRWSYTSMAQVMHEGYAWGEEMRKVIDADRTPERLAAPRAR